jgi:hypothetical protein
MLVFQLQERRKAPWSIVVPLPSFTNAGGAYVERFEPARGAFARPRGTFVLLRRRAWYFCTPRNFVLFFL